MRKTTRSVAALTASLALGASVMVTSAGTAEAAGCSGSALSTVQIGSKGAAAHRAECLLRSAGYATSVNGRFSASDSARAKAFQGKHHIPRTGVVAGRTWTALVSNGSKPYLRYGSKGAAVKRLQASLTASGHKVPTTGFFGPMTRRAVRAYQKNAGVKVTGTANLATWRALQSGRGLADPLPAHHAKKKTKKSTHRASSKAHNVKGSSRAKRAVRFAYAQIGEPYAYGATGPNRWDCSGLTQGAWRAAGKKIPRTSQAQYRHLRHVKKSSLRPGDIVVFYSGRSHVGIYIGKGMVIHASRPGRPVAKIKMKYMPFAGAVRPA